MHPINRDYLQKYRVKLSLRARILIVFSCFLLINGAKAGLLETPQVSDQNPAPDTVKVKNDSLVTTVDTMSVDEGKDIESEITYEAEDSIRVEPENKKVYLFGKAQVHYQDFDLKAEYIEIDTKTNLITAMGIPDSTGKLIGTPEFKDGQNDKIGRASCRERV